eukprot:NODE_6935_length_806_cov_81.838946_g6699_i0.p1 GENE.NODE_6935_length_806_cov_81.838946_g6699_i0~~NODE_6935_length_806_cov_81.838946_g6699_i0.p1  ORF type:complete len:236 (-),score=41.01 NODE_6935_length_806_cov_81.838946_g6699_i0:99-746(-)
MTRLLSPSWWTSHFKSAPPPIVDETPEPAPSPPPKELDVHARRRMERDAYREEHKEEILEEIRNDCRNAVMRNKSFPDIDKVSSILCDTVTAPRHWKFALKCFKTSFNYADSMNEPPLASAIRCRNLPSIEADNARLTCVRQLRRTRDVSYTSACITCSEIFRDFHSEEILRCFRNMDNKGIPHPDAAHICRSINADERSKAYNEYLESQAEQKR